MKLAALRRRELLWLLGVLSLAPKLQLSEVFAGTKKTSEAKLSQRSVINLGFLFENSYAFINHLLPGDRQTGPIGSAFTGTAPVWTSVLDENGWPNDSRASGHLFGGGLRIPDSANFAGPYVLTWEGDGLVSILGGTWTADARQSSNYKAVGNGAYKNIAGKVARVVLAVSTGSGPQNYNLRVNTTGDVGSGATGSFVKNVKVYRLADEADLNAGLVFRAPFKQSLVNLNPSAIRFLNWTDGGSAAREYRFENRARPTNAAYSSGANWTCSPVYPAVMGTNQYSVGTATPTTSNRKTTPISYEHGEVAALLFTNSSVRCTPVLGISAMSNANPCKVTTSSPHGFNTGDRVIHWAVKGMGRLNYFPVTITVVDSLNYTIGADTSNPANYPPFTGGGGAAQYLSLDVGARGAKPIAFPSGDSPASFFGNSIIGGTYYTLYYDKNVSILGDGNGNLIPGAWMYQTDGGPAGMVPLEIMVALVNEINALSTSQGINSPINMWLPIPHTSLTTMDPDYSAASDFAINAVDVILNPSSSKRAAGYSALAPRANLFLEYSNETWNSAGGFYGTPYLARMGSLRWPLSGTTNYVDMYILRSTIVMRGARASVGSSSRLKGVLSGAGFFGYAVGGLNQARVNGSTKSGQAGHFYLTDTITVSGGFGIPINSHDCFATAAYFDAGPSYYAGRGVGSFADDAALYAGATPYSGPNQIQAIANFVAAVKSGTGQSIDTYLNNLLSGLTAQYAAAMNAFGKFAINYEGGPDWPTAAGSSLQGVHRATIADSKFLVAVLNSTQWRDAQVNYFNQTSQLAGSAMPSVYTYIGGPGNQRWSYCMPDTYASSIEGQALLNSPAWVGMSARNQAQTD